VILITSYFFINNYKYFEPVLAPEPQEAMADQNADSDPEDRPIPMRHFVDADGSRASAEDSSAGRPAYTASQKL